MIHELVPSLASEFKVFFLDDGTMGGDTDDLTADLKSIEQQSRARGLILNMSKSELISHDQSVADAMISNFPA